MCECGCGELRPVAKMPAPAGGWYFLEVYPGCRYCDRHWGLGVSRCSASEAIESFWEHFVEETPTVEFGKYEQWGTRILDAGILEREFMASTGESDDLAETPFAFAEFIREGGLIQAFWKTRQAALSSAAPASTERGE